MPTFKIKDLMISLEDKKGVNEPLLCPGLSLCTFHTCFGASCGFVSPTICPLHTTATLCIGCSIHYPTICHYGCSLHFPSIHCTPTINCTPTFIDINKLPETPEFKAYRDQMAELQKSMDEQLKPKTAEDFDQLETKLNDALAELKTQKAAFKKTK